MKNFKVGDKIVYVDKFINHKNKLRIYEVRRIKEKSYIIDRLGTSHWSEVRFDFSDNYELLSILQEINPEYFV